MCCSLFADYRAVLVDMSDNYDPLPEPQKSYNFPFNIWNSNWFSIFELTQAAADFTKRIKPIYFSP